MDQAILNGKVIEEIMTKDFQVDKKVEEMFQALKG